MSDAPGGAGVPLRVLYITQWFEPEPAFKGAAFVAALAARGLAIQVLTGFPNYPGGRLYPGYKLSPIKRDTWEGLPIDRVALWPSHDRSSLGRMVNYVSFFFSVLVYCFFNIGKYDVVYVYHPPITPALAALINGRLRKVPVVLDVQDLWPDSVDASGMGHPVIAGLLGWVCRKVHAGVAHIVCQSEGIARALAERGVPETQLTTIYNWSNYLPALPEVQTNSGAPLPSAVVASFEGHFNVVYGGNLGQAQALECLASAAIEAHSANPRIRLHLFGDGIKRDELVKCAAHSNGGVLVHGFVPREVMDRVFERADALALHLKADPLFLYTIPSKLQHYMSIGRPILAGIDGEGRTLLEACGAAHIFAPMDAVGARDAMLALARLGEDERARMQQSSKAYYSRTLGIGTAVTKTLAIIEQAARRAT